MSVWDALDRVLDAYDADFKVDVGTEYCWSGQLRITLTNPDTAPSRSMTFFSAGQDRPEAVADAVLADFALWLTESGVEPMPPPG